LGKVLIEHEMLVDIAFCMLIFVLSLLFLFQDWTKMIW